MTDLAKTVVGGLILLAVLAAIVVLALHGTIDGQAAMTGIMAIITIGGTAVGAVAVHAAASASSGAQRRRPAPEADAEPPEAKR